MMRIALSVAALALGAGCGGSGQGPGNGSNPPPALQLVYTDPVAGALRLIHDPAGTSAQAISLSLVVGEQPAYRALDVLAGLQHGSCSAEVFADNVTDKACRWPSSTCRTTVSGLGGFFPICIPYERWAISCPWASMGPS